MRVTDSVLLFLETKKGEYISGGEIAEQLGVSRNAVWKAVKTLQEKGYAISAVTNKGYCLSPENRLLSAQSIGKYLTCPSVRVEYRETVTSTNTILKKMAENGEPEGLLLVASEQTAGKGRRGRSFLSNAGTGVYFSLLLRPSLSAADSLLITTCAAVATAKAIEKNAHCDTQIKWVNDVYRNGKKVCGILTEAAFDMEGGGLSYAVLGIGINMFFPENSLPEELRGIAGGVFDNSDYDPEAVSRIVADTVNFFMEEYACLTQKRFLPEYRRRSFLTDKEILVMKPYSQRKAVALGVDDDFRLHVRYPDGNEEFLSSGEVSTKLNG